MNVTVVGLGAGVQSTCLYLMACEGRITPKPDAAIFADTGWEPLAVYEHLDALERYGADFSIPVIRASRGRIQDDVVARNVFATLPAWTRLTGAERVPVAFGECPTCGGFRLLADTADLCPDCDGAGVVPTRWERREGGATLGRIKRQCTPKYKVEPIQREIRKLLGVVPNEVPCRFCGSTGRRVPPWDAEAGECPCSVCGGTGTRELIGTVPKGTRAEQWIGFSTDEYERATTVGFPKYVTPRWPLLEFGMSRSDCIEWMAERGWKGVAKSACLGCPFHDDETWLEIADNDPVQFAALVEFDRAFRTAPGLNAERFLHESRLPRDVAVERYREAKRLGGSQLLLWPELGPKRKVRSCNPFGCRSAEVDEGVVVNFATKAVA